MWPACESSTVLGALRLQVPVLGGVPCCTKLQAGLSKQVDDVCWFKVVGSATNVAAGARYSLLKVRWMWSKCSRPTLMLASVRSCMSVGATRGRQLGVGRLRWPQPCGRLLPAIHTPGPRGAPNLPRTRPRMCSGRLPWEGFRKAGAPIPAAAQIGVCWPASPAPSRPHLGSHTHLGSHVVHEVEARVVEAHSVVGQVVSQREGVAQVHLLDRVQTGVGGLRVEGRGTVPVT